MKKVINNLINKSIVFILVAVILTTSHSFAVVEKSNILKKRESVYVNTDSYGSVEKVNIYNYYELSNVDKIEDFGNYESIQTVTGYNKPDVSGDRITWKVSGDKRLGYIGKASNKLANQLPWTINIKYFLNGVETLVTDLPHQNGLVKVVIKVSPNKEAPEYYQNNYMMQVSASFDMTKYISVHSDEAIEAQVGNTKSLTFMILPGHEKEVNIEIGSDDFKMDSITFAMVPLEGDLLELIEDFVEDKNSIRDAWNTTNESLDVILNGLSNTTGSMERIINGSKELQKGLSSINNNSSKRTSNIDSLKSELKLLMGEIEFIDETMVKFIDDSQYAKDRVGSGESFIKDLNIELNSLSQSLVKNENDLDKLYEKSQNLPDDLGKLNELLVSLKDSVSGLRVLIKDIDATGDTDMKAISSGLINIKNTTEEIATEAGGMLQSGGSDTAFYMEVLSSAKSIGESLQKVSSELTKAQKSMDSVGGSKESLAKDLKSLQDSLGEISKITKRIKEQSKDVPNSISNLNTTLNSLESILQKISNEVDNKLEEDASKITGSLDNLTDILKDIRVIKKELGMVEDTMQNSLDLLKDDLNVISNDLYNSSNNTIDGMNDLLKNLKQISGQSSILKNAKNEIHNIITSDVDDIENKTTVFNMDSDMPTVSFASTKNDSPEKVQIFVQTEAIKEVKDNQTVDMEPQKEKRPFFEKVKEIFEMIANFFKNLFGIK
jgi:putative membrane protein